MINGWNIQHRFLKFNNNVGYAATVVKVCSNIVFYPPDGCLGTVHSIRISHSKKLLCLVPHIFQKRLGLG